MPLPGRLCCVSRKSPIEPDNRGAPPCLSERPAHAIVSLYVPKQKWRSLVSKASLRHHYAYTRLRLEFGLKDQKLSATVCFSLCTGVVLDVRLLEPFPLRGNGGFLTEEEPDLFGDTLASFSDCMNLHESSPHIGLGKPYRALALAIVGAAGSCLASMLYVKGVLDELKDSAFDAGLP